ncbi:class II aldolase/adducin family protein [Gymnodinialimonas sp. 2305UL16-5]|uniref:class II aldolase/adducin family protein n=1 Tax=Gymnodinialimonas mytili TaxID=3126503 RepID=UPI0030963833
MDLPNDFDVFRALSAKLGVDPLQVQGPGGNTSIKQGDTMWIKASGTELAQALDTDIFVAVDRAAALAEAQGAGDGSCKATVLDQSRGLRPSIETTFHAALDWPVVAHTHSIATLTHGVSVQGRAAAAKKLEGLPVVFVPYAKPGLPLTGEILSRISSATQIIVLENHGLICCGQDVSETEAILSEVEQRLQMSARETVTSDPGAAPEGFVWSEYGWMATDAKTTALATAGSYYPDHVVFLGPALPRADHDGAPPAILVEGRGVLIRDGATGSQLAMLRCLSDLLARLPEGWAPEAIGPEAEAELLNWDAEKYRQALAART